MELTNILGVAFQVNVDSVVYAYTRGSASTLLLSKGGVMIDVEETVAEVVTASGGSMTAFTALSGDKTGSIAVNPNYIQTVSSYNSGNDSQIVLCDNTSVRATIVVDTAYASMDAIVEAAVTASLGYDVYAATLTQVAGDAHITEGPLVVGRQYEISTYGEGDDFSNVASVLIGTINELGCVFEATGTTPTTWTNGSELDSYRYIDTPLVLGSNTIGAIVWEFDVVSESYIGTLSGAFTTDGKTVFFTSFQDPAGVTISALEVTDTNSVSLSLSSGGNVSFTIEIRVYT